MKASLIMQMAISKMVISLLHVYLMHSSKIVRMKLLRSHLPVLRKVCGQYSVQLTIWFTPMMEI